MKKIAIYGLSGAGKSTVRQILVKKFKEKKLKVEVVKLAEPLYYMQSVLYETAGKKIEYYQQDQKVLEAMAGLLRNIDSFSIVNYFKRTVKNMDADIIINDDIRDYKTDYQYLKNEGFVFIHVVCDEKIRRSRLEQREDISIVKNSNTTSALEKFTEDFVVENNGTINELEEQINRIISELY